MEIGSYSTGNNNKKVEKMWSCCSDDTGSFPKLNKMQRIGIEDKSGTQLEMSINMFS